MPLPTIRYPLDKTGVNADNYVSGETHTLAALAKRAVIPSYGAFFTESLKVYDVATSALLVRGTDYICSELLTIPTQIYGKEICFLILITNSAVSANVRLDYQVLGGDYQRGSEQIIDLYNMIETALANANVAWPAIIAKPATFAPEPHLHSLDDVYGFEYLAHALERVRNAILLSDSPAMEGVLAYIDGQVAAMIQTVNIRLENGRIPAISPDSGNVLVAHANGLYVSGTPTPGPAPTPATSKPGRIDVFAQGTAPTGYLKANGALVSRTVYAALFAVIGTTYGAGDGSTTFKLPDARGLFIRGWDDARGIDASRVLGSEQLDALKTHVHSMGAVMAQYGAALSGSNVLTGTGTSNTGATGDTETRPRNIAFLICIEY